MTTNNSKRPSRALALGLVALGALIAAAILVGVASAKTIVPKQYDGTYPAATFDGTGSVGAPSPFSGFGAVKFLAVDDETGTVYVGSPASNRLYKFDASGNAQPFTEVAPNTALVQTFESFGGDLFVDNSGGPRQGRIYVIPGDGTLMAYEPSGAPAPNYPVPVASIGAGDVAPDGSLWLLNGSTEKLEQFNSTTVAPTGKSFTAPLPYRMAIDSQNDFYVSSFTSGLIKKYDSNGKFQETLDTEGGGGYADIAVNLSNDHVFIGYSERVIEYDDAGTYQTSFGSSEGSYPGLGGSEGIAVRSASGKVYAINNGTYPPTVDRFAPVGTAVVPDAETGEALPEGAEATVNATINPDGVATTDCHFDWGPTRAYTGPDIPCTEGNAFGGSGDNAVSATLSGLSEGITYHYRISTKNANNRVVPGKDRTFVAQGIPTVSGEFASKVNSDGARINAVIDPQGGATTFHIEYGTDTGYGSIAPVPDVRVLGYTTEAQAVSADIGSSSRKPNTTTG